MPQWWKANRSGNWNSESRGNVGRGSFPIKAMVPRNKFIKQENCLRGSTNWQVQEIFHKSGINQIGNSKHSAKETVRATLQWVSLNI